MSSLEQRDQQLRWRMWNIVRLAQGWCRATRMADDARDDEGVPCDSDEHALRLIGELAEWGLIEREHVVETAGVRRTWRHDRYRTTEKGQKMWAGEIRVPGVSYEGAD